MVAGKQLIANIYNPDNFSRKELIDRFVVRLDFFERLYLELKDSKMDKPEQQYLLVARRGMGKTTFLLRLAYQMENDPDINTWMLPVVFNEEEYGIDQLELFWEKVARNLEEHYPEFDGLQQEMADLYEPNKDKEQVFEEEAFLLLLHRLRANGKKIVLFIDNFGDIFNRFKTWEIQRLRTVLQTIPDLRIVGASSIVLDQVYNAQHPFYEFFRVKDLKGLSLEETKTLLRSLASLENDTNVIDIVENQTRRVESLRRLTGGVIRTIILLYEVFSEERDGKALKDLAIIVDRTTPLYKDRVDDLPAQQKKIVDAIAQAWDGVTAKEISLRTRLETKNISAQLSPLTISGVVERRQIPNTKNHIYLINERFFNIWYLMRYGRKDNRVIWLTRFLEEWCGDGAHLAERTQKHIEALQPGTYDKDGAYLMTEALARAKGLDRDVQHNLLTAAKGFFQEIGSELAGQLSESDKSLLEKANGLIKSGEYGAAIKELNKMVEPDLFALGTANYYLKDFRKASEYMLKVNSGTSLSNLGFMYDNDLKDTLKAEAYYLKAIEKGNIAALNNLANLYTEKKEIEKAEEYYLKAIDKGSESAVNGLCWMYFTSVQKKTDAIKLAKELAASADLSTHVAHTAASVLLWNEEYESCIEISNHFLYDEGIIAESEKSYIDFLLLCLAKKQYDFVYNYFNGEKGQALQVKDRFKPVWYALMYFMKEQYPLEYIRMGDELKETVEEVVAKVREYAEKYS
jgi:TPR repeat protein